MRILADADGKKAIESLCDVAVRSGGLNNIQAVQMILNIVEPVTEEDKEDK